MSEKLKPEFDYYLDNQKKLARKHNGRVVVIKGREVIGVYDDPVVAVSETQKEHKIGTFLVQRVARGPEAHTQVFHSRVALDRRSG